jgi:hypothetical protein
MAKIASMVFFLTVTLLIIHKIKVTSTPPEKPTGGPNILCFHRFRALNATKGFAPFNAIKFHVLANNRNIV